MFSCLTNDEIFVCLKYCLGYVRLEKLDSRDLTYARTLEKSVQGDMTKLSLELDQDIKVRILWSSNILGLYQ